jgi:hypothetical protein
MDAHVNLRPARDLSSLAPCRIQAVLDMALEASGSGGQKMHQQGIHQIPKSQQKRDSLQIPAQSRITYLWPKFAAWVL